MRSIVLLPTVLTASLVSGAPQIDFPINAQVPPVARVSQPYSYQFSVQTFSSSNDLKYSIQNAPAWLQLDATSRTFSGTPGASDLGRLTLDLVADDGNGSTTLQATLVVVDTGTPQASNVTTALSQAGPLADITALSTRSASSFRIAFGQDTFSSVTNALYYATSSDRSPLPSWVDFDPTSLTFSGTTPPDMAAPQIYGLTLYISTVKGFSEASISFGIAVGNHQLYFTSVIGSISIPDNGTVIYMGLEDNLRLDGEPAQSQYLTSVTLQGPDWLSFDNDTFVLSGLAPNDTIAQNIIVVAKDTYGDIASSTLMLLAAQMPSQAQPPSFFAGLPSVVNASIGEFFSYSISKSAIKIADYTSRLDLSAADSWLSYDANNLTMHGNVPNNAKNSNITADLVVTTTSTNTSETAVILIHLQPRSTTQGGDSSGPTTTPATHNPKQLSTGAAAAIGVLCTLLGILLLLALLYAIYRTMTAKRHQKKKPRPWISRPIKPDPSNHWVNYHADVPIGDGDGSIHDGSATSVAPSRLGTHPEHARTQSDGSYLQAEDVDAITAINRTSLGTDVVDQGHHPHDAMKLPTLMARLRRARAKSSRSKDYPKGSMWPGSLKLKRLRSLRDDEAASYYPGDEAEFRSSTIHDESSTQIDEHGTIMHKSHRRPNQSSISHASRSTPPTIPLRNVNRPSKPIRFVSVAPTLRDFPITDPTILNEHPHNTDIKDAGPDSYKAPTIYTQYTQSTLPSLPSPAKAPIDPRPVTEKRASYIRHRAEARAEGNSRGNMLFSASGVLNSDGDRGRGSRLLAKLRGSSRSRSPQKRESRPVSNMPSHKAKPSRSRSSSMGIPLAALTERTELSEMEAHVEEWATTAAHSSPARTNTTGPTVRHQGAPVFEDDVPDVSADEFGDAEEERRQSKRRRWRDKLNRDSKGQMGPGVRQEALLSARIASGAGEQPSKESVNFRTASWVREALGDGDGNSRAKEAGEYRGKAMDGFEGRGYDGDDGWRHRRAWSLGENGVVSGKRFASSTTQESGTYAFL